MSRYRYLIAKILLIAFLIAYLIWLVAGESTADVSIKSIKNEIFAQNKMTTVKKCTNKELNRYYGLLTDDFDGCVYYKATSPMAVEELLIIKVKDKSQIGAVEDSIDSRVDSQKESFEGYGAKQTALLSAHITDAKGDYVFFAVSKDAEKWKASFDKAIKGKD